MRFFLPVIGVLLLTGCGSFQERQDRANRVIDQAAQAVGSGVNVLKDAGGTLADGVSKTAGTINATVSDLEEKADQVQSGTRKITGAAQDVQRAADEAKSGLQDIKNIVE